MNIEEALRKIEQAENLLSQAKEALLASSLPKEQSKKDVPKEESTNDNEYDIDTISGIVSVLLSLAIKNPTDEEAEPELDRITHVSIDAKALSSLMRYNWSRLKSQVQDYLSDAANPSSFTIVREQDRNTGNIEEKKVFLSAKSRNPVPLTLRKDLGEEHWRIYTFSL
ncbi:MAG: hypothetical protein CL916_14055 [Deltaproteobacteria bacterium]|nr:hypothetical protein [Deltaproteobacteria bacterium]